MSALLRRLAGPVALCCVLAGALVVGSGAFDAPATASSRVASIERLVRCPSCTGTLSVAQDNAPSSIAVRNEIAAAVGAGRSDDEVLNALVRRYGATILLEPRGTASTLLWAVPVVIAAGAVLAAAIAVVRRRQVG